ncbi:MAG: hypothetical protein GX657_09340, partial [Chloroflexi bacterium]|nr:hypothetical protein [Chloroflexota bacterium]
MLSEDLVREIVALRRRVERLEAQEPVAGALRGANAEIDAQGFARFRGVASPGVPFATDALFCCHFDGPAPYETDYSLNTTGHRGQEATRSGGVIGRPG